MICNQRARTLEHTAVFRQLARLRVSEAVVLRVARFEISCCVLIFYMINAYLRAGSHQTTQSSD